MVLFLFLSCFDNAKSISRCVNENLKNCYYIGTTPFFLVISKDSTILVDSTYNFSGIKDEAAEKRV